MFRAGARKPIPLGADEFADCELVGGKTLDSRLRGNDINRRLRGNDTNPTSVVPAKAGIQWLF
jgi:hypothetical protein